MLSGIGGGQCRFQTTQKKFRMMIRTYKGRFFSLTVSRLYSILAVLKIRLRRIWRGRSISHVFISKTYFFIFWEFGTGPDSQRVSPAIKRQIIQDLNQMKMFGCLFTKHQGNPILFWGVGAKPIPRKVSPYNKNIFWGFRVKTEPPAVL